MSDHSNKNLCGLSKVGSNGPQALFPKSETKFAHVVETTAWRLHLRVGVLCMLSAASPEHIHEAHRLVAFSTPIPGRRYPSAILIVSLLSVLWCSRTLGSACIRQPPASPRARSWTVSRSSSQRSGTAPARDSISGAVCMLCAQRRWSRRGTLRATAFGERQQDPPPPHWNEVVGDCHLSRNIGVA